MKSYILARRFRDGQLTFIAGEEPATPSFWPVPDLARHFETADDAADFLDTMQYAIGTESGFKVLEVDGSSMLQIEP